MYKVAIVDDEPVIVRGLAMTIQWEKYNCRVVGTAGDGQEGIDGSGKEAGYPHFRYLYARD